MSRRTMPYVTVLLVLLLSGLPLQAAAPSPFAAVQPLPPAQSARLLSSTGSGVSFILRVPWQTLVPEPVTIAGREYVRVSIPGWSTTADGGSPELPLWAEAIGVPFGATLSLRVEPGPAHVVKLQAPVVPVAGLQVDFGPPAGALPFAELTAPRSVIAENPEVYSGSAPYPGVLARIATDGMQRQQRMAAVAAYPMQYRPATGELTVYEWLRIDVAFEGASARSAASEAGQTAADSPAYEQVFRSELLNYDAARQWRKSVPAAASSAASSLAWAPPVPGWRLKVREEGLYKLTYGEVQAAGLPVDALSPGTLRLYNLGREVAIYVSGEADGRFDPTDFVLFYGQGLRNKYTRDNVYWLTYGGGQGLRMAARDGSPAAGAQPSYYRSTRHLESNLMYRPSAPGDANLDRWLWDYVSPPDKPGWTHTFSLPAPHAGPYTATLKLAMLGSAGDLSINPDHHTQIYLNGALLENGLWDGEAWRAAQIQFSQGLLLSGDNSVTVVCPNDTGLGYDAVFVDWAELEFAAPFRADADQLAFGYETPGVWDYRVDGFSASQVTVYDVTDPAAPVRIEGVDISGSDSQFVTLFEDAVSAPTRYLAVADSAVRAVQAVEPDAPSDLRSTSNGADYIIITHSDFAGEAARLGAYRASQGLRSVLVDVQDVYDEFGYGLAGAQPIHDFLAYAYNSWHGPAPSFVVLVGDGHYDPNDYLGYGRVSYLPPYLAPADPWIRETAADNRYVTVAGDDAFPDMMLGRLSVNSAAEASAVIDKILAYEQSPGPGDWRTQVLMVADNADTAGDFAATSNELLACCLPATYEPEKVYYGVTHLATADARRAISTGINAGKLIVNFAGHAAVTAWASEGLFKTTDVPSLQNGGMLPVMLPMSCYDGFYHYPYPAADGYEALGEVVTRAGGRGAIASWSPTGLGLGSAHEDLDRGFFDAVFAEGARTLGAATMAGKLRLWETGSNLDLLDTFLLFGDPATRLPLAPVSAPVAPQIAIEHAAGGATVDLNWLHSLENEQYEVWRGTSPYFDPGLGEGNQIERINAQPFGAMSPVSYTDDGVDNYYGAGDPQLPPVQVIGDVAVSYFWVVRGRNSSGVSGNSNRVGEFDYSLVP